MDAAHLPGPLKDRPLFPGHSECDLPRRLCEVLCCLLRGDSEKQVAQRLGLSPHTVHGYVKTLHQHLGVASRGELLAAGHALHLDEEDRGHDPEGMIAI